MCYHHIAKQRLIFEVHKTAPQLNDRGRTAQWHELGRERRWERAAAGRHFRSSNRGDSVKMTQEGRVWSQELDAQPAGDMPLFRDAWHRWCAASACGRPCAGAPAASKTYKTLQARGTRHRCIQKGHNVMHVSMTLACDGSTQAATGRGGRCTIMGKHMTILTRAAQGGRGNHSGQAAGAAAGVPALLRFSPRAGR